MTTSRPANTGFGIFEIAAGGGRLALCPMPGRYGDYPGDLGMIRVWGAGLVLSMATEPELVEYGASTLPADLAKHGTVWHHLPVEDFGADSASLRDSWAGASLEARRLLSDGGRVLTHCLGGCGRSGMAVLRLMIELGEPADAALARLRAVRPCAVETEAQRLWAAGIAPRP
ncbi:protein phosphatase [Defluviimonas aestuarii]|uniref:protein-tyrosine phosphatase family protein n=1 Tax=Albidovulum aestuarii TaxID=1130726 RepID=UPI00249A6D07|nr:protein phosphatase [Defluviimonas aestuarii]MDI3336970.1 protein phosphatase [Defluviimonas aestuarii]